MINIKKYELLQGDCLCRMKEIEDKSVDLVLCDLPYGTTSCKWDSIIDLDLLWKEYDRITKENAAIVLFSAQPFTTKLISSNMKNYRYSWYWMKNNSTGHVFAKYQPMRKIEDINVFYKKRPLYIPQGLIKLDKPKQKQKKRTDKEMIYDQDSLLKPYIQEYTNYPHNVLEFKKEINCIHPTQKPIALLEYLIRTYTRESDLVLDNCFGSGSTGVAAANTSRRFIGIEKDEKYFKEGSDRIVKAYL
ncbi:MAG: DNA-methyltransferase [Intestinibacter sp.]|uniref:DNA-methyltransferase n=1 Tax=Intestinibacter sp. TaxID=1965304 RepID=UPI003F1794AA